MGIRETLNKNSALTTIGTIAIILLTLVIIVYEMKPKAPKFLNAVYYTSDDGQSYFGDEMSNVPPYSHSGQDAVLCHVFSCTGKPVALFLEKYTPEMKATLDDPNHGDVNPDSGSLVKKPGDKDWVPRNSKAGKAVMDLKCPDGTTAIDSVLPGQ